MATIFFASDLHLGHASVVEFDDSPLRSQFSCVEEHDEFIIQHWNAIVTKRDVVWLLGDVAFNQAGISALSRLQGIKHLVLGNHDKMDKNFHPFFFNKICGAVCFKGEFLLTHIPVHPDSIKPRFTANIHGHTHSNNYNPKLYFNCSMENINMEPISFDEIKIRLAKEQL